MRRQMSRLTLFLQILLITHCGTAEGPVEPAPAGQTMPSEQGERLAGSYIVAFKSPSSNASTGSSFTYERNSHFLPLWQGTAALAEVAAINYITALNLTEPKESFAPSEIAPPVNLAIDARRFPQNWASIARVDFRSEEEAEATLQKWQDLGRIWFFEPNYLSRLKELPNFAEWAERSESLSENWWHHRIRLPAAYRALAELLDSAELARIEQEPPVIAVLDSGIDIEHPALAEQIWVNPRPGHNSCGQDLYGCNTSLEGKNQLGQPEIYPYRTSGPGEHCNATLGADLAEQQDIERNCRHGTHVAGIIAAGELEGQSSAGVCPFCKILPIRVVRSIDGRGKVPDTAILNGMKYVSLLKRNGRPLVRVVNSSFGKFQRSQVVSLLVQALEGLPGGGVLVVGAAGNEESMKRTYPAAFENALAVTSIDGDQRKSSFSNFGPWTDIAAPGGFDPESQKEILSSVPGGSVDYAQGTSMAAPMVSGAAGLLVALDPSLSAAQIKQRLLAAANPDIYNDEFNRHYYYRRVQSSKDPVPLLGTGQLDVEAALLGQQTGVQPAQRLDRVQPGCGTIGTSSQSMSGSWLLMIAPLFFTWFAWRRRR